MSRLTRSEQIIAEKTVCILLVRGETPEGSKIFAYVAIRADKLEAFMEAQKQGTFYPEDYGIIIESGEGDPSDEVRARMTAEYGFNHEAMLDIANTEKAGDVAGNLSSYAAQAAQKRREE